MSTFALKVVSDEDYSSQELGSASGCMRPMQLRLDCQLLYPMQYNVVNHVSLWRWRCVRLLDPETLRSLAGWGIAWRDCHRRNIFILIPVCVRQSREPDHREPLHERSQVHLNPVDRTRMSTPSTIPETAWRSILFWTIARRGSACPGRCAGIRRHIGNER